MERDRAFTAIVAPSPHLTSLRVSSRPWSLHQPWGQHLAVVSCMGHFPQCPGAVLPFLVQVSPTCDVPHRCRGDAPAASSDRFRQPRWSGRLLAPLCKTDTHTHTRTVMCSLRTDTHYASTLQSLSWSGEYWYKADCRQRYLCDQSWTRGGFGQ